MGILLGFTIIAIILAPVGIWFLYKDIKSLKRYGTTLIQCPRCEFTYSNYLQKCPHCKNIADDNLDKAIELKKLSNHKLKKFMWFGALFFFFIFVAGLFSL